MRKVLVLLSLGTCAKDGTVYIQSNPNIVGCHLYLFHIYRGRENQWLSEGSSANLDPRIDVGVSGDYKDIWDIMRLNRIWIEKDATDLVVVLQKRHLVFAFKITLNVCLFLIKWISLFIYNPKLHKFMYEVRVPYL